MDEKLNNIAILDTLGVPYRHAQSANATIDCPFCGGAGKIGVGTIKDVWRCNKCNKGGGSVQLYAMLKYGTDPEELALLPGDDSETEEENQKRQQKRRKLYGEMMRALSRSEQEGVAIRTLVRDVPREEELAPVERRDEVYRAMMGMLALDEEDRANLRNRGLGDREIDLLGYRSFPKSTKKRVIARLLEMNKDLTGVPGFFKNRSGEWDMVTLNGFMIPVRDQTGVLKRGLGYIQGFQVRNPAPDAKPRYLWWSSNGQEGGTGAKTWCHLSGYPEEVVILTEGALKADVIHHCTGMPVLALMGVNCQNYVEENIRMLQACGTQRVLIAYDMDALEKQEVRSALERLRNKLDECGMSHSTLSWEKAYREHGCKGYDDYLLWKSKNKGA